MADEPKNPEEKKRSEIIATGVEGRVRLEHSSVQGYIVSFIIGKQPIWVSFDLLNDAMKDFEAIIEIKSKKPVKLTIQKTKQNENDESA